MRQVRYTLLLLLMVIIARQGWAQQSAHDKAMSFHSINSIGLLKDGASGAAQLQTINGIRYKSWFAGIGLGLDYYRYRSIPLFADIRKTFGKKDNKPFVYTDAGVNFYWQRDNDDKAFQLDDRFKNGFYAEAGLGYSIKLTEKLHLQFSGGFSYKELAEQGRSLIYYTDIPINVDPYIYTNPPGGNLSTVKYRFRRLVLKAGIAF